MAKNETKFDVLAWIANVRKAEATAMSEEQALNLFPTENDETTAIIETTEKQAARDNAFSAVGFGKEKDRQLVGIFTDRGMVSARVLVDTAGNWLLSSVQLWTDNAKVVSAAQTANAPLMQAHDKTWAMCYRIGGTYAKHDDTIKRYRDGSFNPHDNAAESFWVRAMFERVGKWFKL